MTASSKTIAIQVDHLEAPRRLWRSRRRTAPGIWQQVEAALKDCDSEPGETDICLDLSEFQKINTLGINELIRTQSKVRARGGHLRLRGLCDSVRAVFRLTRLERVFEFEDEPATIV